MKKTTYEIVRQGEILRMEMVSRYLARKVSRAEYDSRVKRINAAVVNTRLGNAKLYQGDDDSRPE